MQDAETAPIPTICDPRNRIETRFRGSRPERGEVVARLMGRNAGIARRERGMSRKSGITISDTARGLAAADTGGDWHDVPCHHRYYGSSAFNGGERIIERRSGLGTRAARLGSF